MKNIIKITDSRELKKLITFIILTYLISWLIALPLVLNKQFSMNLFVFPYQHFLVAFGPFLGAIITTFLFDKFSGLKSFFKTIFSFKSSRFIYLFVIIIPIFAYALGITIDFITSGKFIDFSKIGLSSEINSTNLLFILLIWVFSYGLGEEAGWRGFLLPILNKNNSTYKSAIIISLVWVLWHLPFFFYNPNFMAFGWMAIGWALGLVFGSILLSFISVNSNYSIIPVLIWHGIFDFFTSSDISGGTIAAITSMFVIVLAVFLHIKYGNSLKIDILNLNKKSINQEIG